MQKPCKKCQNVRSITRHHYLPKRWFKKDKEARKKVTHLCRPCHDNAEYVLHIAEHDEKGKQHQLRAWQYLALHQTFMKEGMEKAKEFALLISRSHRHERQAKVS